MRRKLADKLSAALAAPIYMDQTWQISASIGIAQGAAGRHHRRRIAAPCERWRCAPPSAAGAARCAISCRKFTNEHAERRFFLRELETAIAQDAFDVHYQPVVAAEGGGMVGVEALMRWNASDARRDRAVAVHSARRGKRPDDQARRNRDAPRAGRRRALAEPVRLRQPVAGADAGAAGSPNLVAAVLAETGMPAARLVLEITEGILIDDPEDTQHKLEALRALGVSTALDDFGTGYSSLSYLQKFQFDRLKIDRSFVASLGTTGNAGAIIQSIVTLGHALGMKVLAEGVETNEQRVLLRLAGCDEMQGFLFAKACPAEAIDKILARRRWRPAPARRVRQRSSDGRILTGRRPSRYL